MRWFGKMYILGKVYMFPTHEPSYVKNYERLLFIINILCNHGNTKLLGSLVQWCFDLTGVAIKEGRDK